VTVYGVPSAPGSVLANNSPVPFTYVAATKVRKTKKNKEKQRKTKKNKEKQRKTKKNKGKRKETKRKGESKKEKAN
jgi:hypothetical protein